MFSIEMLVLNSLFLINCELSIFFFSFYKSQQYLNNDLYSIKINFADKIRRSLDLKAMDKLIFRLERNIYECSEENEIESLYIAPYLLNNHYIYYKEYENYCYDYGFYNYINQDLHDDSIISNHDSYDIAYMYNKVGLLQEHIDHLDYIKKDEIIKDVPIIYLNKDSNINEPTIYIKVNDLLDILVINDKKNNNNTNISIRNSKLYNKLILSTPNFSNNEKKSEKFLKINDIYKAANSKSGNYSNKINISTSIKLILDSLKEYADTLEEVINEMNVIYLKQKSIYDKVVFIMRLLKFYETFHKTKLKQIDSNFYFSLEYIDKLRSTYDEVIWFINYYNKLFSMFEFYKSELVNKNNELFEYKA